MYFCICIVAFYISTHTLTWSVTLCVIMCACQHDEFQLTRSRGAWRTTSLNFQDVQYFNSHAHVERDPSDTQPKYVVFISTHTLTWSVTFGFGSLTVIALFQLTRSRGAWQRAQEVKSRFPNFNSHAHVERDIAVNGLFALYIIFQLTRSRGAWPAILKSKKEEWKISTHTLTWSVTKPEDLLEADSFISTHTLTWSVTLLHNYRSKMPPISTHTLTWSVTVTPSYVAVTSAISTHTLTWSVTCSGRKWWTWQRYFNSHAHVERDRLKGVKKWVQK